MSKPVRIGIVVDDANGAHVHFRLFAACGGEHLGQAGKLVMHHDEYHAFIAAIAPLLTDGVGPESPVGSEDGDA